MGRGFIDVIGIEHASIEAIKFAADSEDALLEFVTIFLDDFWGDIEIDFMIG